MKMNVDKILFGLKTTNFDPTKICVSTISVMSLYLYWNNIVHGYTEYNGLLQVQEDPRGQV